MKIIQLYKIMLLILLVTAIGACDDKVNDWHVDPSVNRLFKPLLFDQAILTATSVEVKYSPVINAKVYIFELSEDSLAFSNIVRTINVMADTITPFASSGQPVRNEYRLLFKELNGNTRYSVRMKAYAGDTSLYSNTVQFTFRTPAENIFNSAFAGFDEANISWIPSNRVSYILLTEDADVSHVNILTDSLITENEKTLATKSVTGLKLGTFYTAGIYYNDVTKQVLRGTISFKTTGTAGSEVHKVISTENLDSILTVLVSEGKTNITLAFSNDSVYNFNLNKLTIPAGVINLTFTATAGGIKPLLNLNSISVSSTISGIDFENVSLKGSNKDADYLFNSGIEVQSFSFEGCEMDNYRSIVRLSNVAMNVQKILFNNCQIKNIGGYGVVNIGGTSVTLSELRVTNCTLTELATQFSDIRTPSTTFYFGNCTFYNNAVSMTQLFRFNADTNVPGSLLVEKCIFSGSNAGLKINATDRATTAYTTISFASSYKTSEFVENRTDRLFVDVIPYSGTAADLFTDPVTGDFSIKAGAGFAGEGEAGDPRWFN